VFIASVEGLSGSHVLRSELQEMRMDLLKVAQRAAHPQQDEGDAGAGSRDDGEMAAMQLDAGDELELPPDDGERWYSQPAGLAGAAEPSTRRSPNSMRPTRLPALPDTPAVFSQRAPPAELLLDDDDELLALAMGEPAPAFAAQGGRQLPEEEDDLLLPPDDEDEALAAEQAAAPTAGPLGDQALPMQQAVQQAQQTQQRGGSGGDEPAAMQLDAGDDLQLPPEDDGTRVPSCRRPWGSAALGQPLPKQCEASTAADPALKPRCCHCCCRRAAPGR
jgi:hypothetical protein